MTSDENKADQAQAEKILEMVERLKSELLEGEVKQLLPDVSQLSWWERLKVRLWGLKNIDYLLDENSLSISACSAFSLTPSGGTPAVQLVKKCLDADLELEEATRLLKMGSLLMKGAKSGIESTTQENERLREVIKKASNDLGRVRSESKVLRAVKADLTDGLVSNPVADNDPEQDVGGISSAEAA